MDYKKHYEKLSKVRTGVKRTPDFIYNLSVHNWKPVEIEGIRFKNMKDAYEVCVDFLGISKTTIYRRIKSSKFVNYKYL